MHCRFTRRFCGASLVLASLFGSGTSAPCDFLSTGLIGIGEEIPFDSASKLSVVGFSAVISYVTLAADATPYIKITSASEQPAISTEDGVLTIETETCEAITESPTTSPTSSPTAADVTSSATMVVSGFVASFFAPRSMGSLIFMASLMGSMTGAYGQDVCTPSLEIEISLPVGTGVDSTFGDTDHYLAANLDTVVWGYYDINKPASISMNSGETITVEVITHHAGHDYAKMIRGDEAIEEIFYWATNTSLAEKPEPKLIGTGVHLITGPIEVVGAMPGDVIQVDILELDPRLNPLSGKCYGSNSQKFAGFHYNSLTGFKRDGTPYVRTGGTEAITVFEFLETDAGKMIWGKPVYMFRFPNMTAPDGSIRTFDNNPAVMIPHEFNYGYDGKLLEPDALVYPEGFDGTMVIDEGGIKYLSPEEANLNWKIPLRPHLGTLAVMPNNTENYIDESAQGGANTIPPSRFGGNIDDWRIGKGGTMYYTVEVPGAQIVVGDTHAAQGDAELAGTAMETSMTTKLRVTLHKADSLPNIVQDLVFPLLETSDKYVIHGFAFDNYLDQLDDASTIFQEGASLDLAMADCFIKTRNWLMDTQDLTEEETIAMMATAVDFGITQVVDGNWGVHADVDKWIFDTTDTPYDYTCTTSKSNRRRSLLVKDDSRRILEKHSVTESPEEYADKLFSRVTSDCAACVNSAHRRRVSEKMLEAKLKFAKRNEILNGEF